MTHKLCRCGRIVKDRCLACHPWTHAKTTKERGYDNNWKKLSERIRKNEPLCHDCQAKGIATPAKEVHHIIKIKDAPGLKYEQDNLVPLCEACHRERHRNE